MLKGKKIIIGITGSIAAYKACFLVRLLKKENAEVQVILTDAAQDFVTPLTLSALSQENVLTEPFDPVDGSWNSHVDLGNQADLLLIAPASANTIAKCANGIADNLLSCTFLAAKCPVMIAPAMDLDMYKHPQTQENISKLSNQGNIIIAPASGELASGLYGCGRMEEPEMILKQIKSFFQKKKS